ncbi:hypothetical protein IQ06DRAFT_41 [Phaeosphaeriaceae sp. SRC1lsM3a]|nr:hypothetical protein IQ06DRAFT_41 [Stagonospora sp. SRC1lsM3a]
MTRPKLVRYGPHRMLATNLGPWKSISFYLRRVHSDQCSWSTSACAALCMYIIICGYCTFVKTCSGLVAMSGGSTTAAEKQWVEDMWDVHFQLHFMSPLRQSCYARTSRISSNWTSLAFLLDRVLITS